ncbi:transcriptional regulator [Fusobacterium necrophorum BFTR-2]|nr:helix-turn-helix domain-containing protein [Fusobacterium necrophorum]KDE74871.1 transcriptional regulator [Fusobacterium necrophorum BFTR-2]
MENIELGYEIRKIRKLKKLTQQEVADLTGVSLKTIQRYEKGQNIPKSFLNIFYDNLNLEPYQGNSMNLLYSGIGANRHEEIKFYVNEIIKEIGYEIKSLDSGIISGNPFNVIIKNNITDEYMTEVVSPYNFDYSSMVFNFLKTLVENDLKSAKIIPSHEVPFIFSEDYQDFMRYYNAKFQALRFENIKSGNYSLEPDPKKLKELNDWKEVELQKLRERFFNKK